MSYQVLNNQTFIPIAETTLSSNTLSVTFNSLGSYDHLWLTINARTTHTDYQDIVTLTFNGDTGNSYNYKWFIGAGGGSDNLISGHSSLSTAIQPGLVSAASFGDANVFGSLATLIPNYRGTTFKKNVISYAHGTGQKDAASNYIAIGFYSGSWNSTDAITSLTLRSVQNANFVSGSNFALWGI